MHVVLVADRAEVLIDAEHDQDEFRRDARENNAGNHGSEAILPVVLRRLTTVHLFGYNNLVLGNFYAIGDPSRPIGIRFR